MSIKKYPSPPQIKKSIEINQKSNTSKLNDKSILTVSYRIKNEKNKIKL